MDCTHVTKSWRQVGRCVYCACGERLYQGSAPSDATPEQKMELLSTLGILDEDAIASVLRSGELAAYERGVEKAKQEMAAAHRPLIVGVVDPFDVRGSDRRILRQSMINQADVCNLRVAYDMTHGGGTSIERIIGTAYHAGLAKFYETSALASPADVKRAVFESFDEGIELARTMGVELVYERVENEIAARELALQLVRLNIKHHCWDLGDFEVVAVELSWWWPLSDTWAAHGTIDLVLRDRRSGLFVLVDHKTASKTWKKGKESARATVQPAWYLAFWPGIWNAATQPEAATPETVAARFCFDIMTYTGSFERRWADRNDAEIRRCFDKAAILATLIDNNGPWWPNQAHFLCDERWCDHWDRCSFGAGVSTDVDPAPVFIDVRSRTVEAVEAVEVDPE